MSLETTPAKIQADFDRLAILEENTWSHNDHYQNFLLAQLPARLENALEIGCGTGSFCRQLATKADKVLGLDFSSQMVRLAQERSRDFSQIEYIQADVLQHNFQNQQFDCIAAIATLHHIPMRAALLLLKDLLKPGGTLLILDLYEAQTLSEKAYAGLAILPNLVLKRLKNGTFKTSPELEAAWVEHGKTDVYLSLSELRQIAAELLPQAEIRRHLFWRYSLVWRKPN